MDTKSLKPASSKSPGAVRTLSVVAKVYLLVMLSLFALVLMRTSASAAQPSKVHFACPLVQPGGHCAGPPTIHCNFNKVPPGTLSPPCQLPPRPVLCLPNELRSKTGVCAHVRGILPGAGCIPRPGYACPGAVERVPPLQPRNGTGHSGSGNGYYNYQLHRFVPLSKKSSHHEEVFTFLIVLISILVLISIALLTRRRYSLKQWSDGGHSPSFEAGVAAAEAQKAKSDKADDDQEDLEHA